MKHTSNLSTEREAALTIFRGLVAGSFPAKGRVSVCRPAYLLRVMVQGTLLPQAAAIPAVSPSRVYHDVGHRSPVAIDLKLMELPSMVPSSIGQVLPLPGSIGCQHAGFRLQSYDCIHRAHLAAHVKLPLAFGKDCAELTVR